MKTYHLDPVRATPGELRPATKAALVREFRAKLDEQADLRDRHRAFVVEQSRLRVVEPIEACGWAEYADLTSAMLRREELLAASVARMRAALRNVGVEPFDYIGGRDER